MAIRVRKLAKELRRTPGDVLGVLHHLGYVNYKRADDMIPDGPADKLRRAIKKGVTAPPVVVPVSKAPSSVAANHTDDLMAQLVPGVVKQGGAPAAAQRPVAPPTPTPRPVAPAPPPQPKAPPPDLSGDVAALKARVAALEAERDALRGQVDALTGEQEALKAQADLAQPEGVAVAQLLQQRGLRGSDESLRALQALLAARRGAAVLDGHLGASAARSLVTDLGALVLLDGDPPEELTVPGVAVASDRAEAPSGPTLDRLLRELSEDLLLSGWRRLALVGVPPRWHGALRARVDRRVELSFHPAGQWSEEQVASLPADVVGAVGFPRTADEVKAWSKSPWVLEENLSSLLRQLLQLARGDG